MFRTSVHPKATDHRLSIGSPLLTIGSCFADSMGHRFHKYKFKVLCNPFGTLFNPVSIFQSLSDALQGQSPSPDSYLENQGLHLNYGFHSSFRAEDKGVLKLRMEEALQECGAHLRKCNWLIMTWGSSFVHIKKDSGKIVSNCHKMPSGLFEKKLLSQEEVRAAFDTFYTILKKDNPDIKIILTLSPVRHIKEGLEMNQVSKAILREACYHLTQAHGDITYFPSYEIMMDDLRDYRYYKKDMLHPSEVAEDYIWTKFSQNYFDGETTHFMEHWEKILKAIAHRPFNPHTEAHQRFLKNTLNQLGEWKGKVDVQEEHSKLEAMLKDTP